MLSSKVFFLLQSIFRYFPFKLGIYLRRVIYKPFFKTLGKNVRIMDAVVIKYPGEIELGNNLTINQFCYIVGKGGLVIGNDVMIGAGTKITTTTHITSSPNIPMVQQGIACEPIVIGNDIWLGFNAVVLGGSTIGDSSIVAANCVINGGSFDEFTIIGGVPARVLGTRK